MNRAQKALVGGAILAAVLAGGAFGAALTGGATAATGTMSAGARSDQTDDGHRYRSDEVPLTGDTAAKVTAAVSAKYPDATIQRLETDADGDAYEAHVILADGSEATVKLNEAFTVTGTETGHHHGDRSRDGRGGRHSDETPLTGDTAAKVTAAVTARYPDATIQRVETDNHGDAYEAHVILADGSRATVKLDESFTITRTKTGH